MKGKRVAFLGFLLTILIIIVVIFFWSGVIEKKKPSLKAHALEFEPLSPKPEETRKIVLFFLSEEDTLLHLEEREIAADSSIVRQAKQTIQELIKGSQRGYISPFPLETRLRELFVTKDGVAHVDFSEDIVERNLFGSSAEISTIFSVVNSLAYNFETIKEVFILIEGQEKETLGGHINLSRPFLPLYDLVAY